MKKAIILVLFLLITFFLFPFNSPSSASPIYIEYNEVYTGAQPRGNTPWLTALFEDMGTAGVLLTLSAPNLVKWEFVSGWYFNFNPDNDVDALVFSHVDGLRPYLKKKWDYTKEDGFNQAGGGLGFDIKIPFSTRYCKRFTDGIYSQFMISGLDDLLAADFNYQLSKNDEEFVSAAHIQGIGNCGHHSAWVKGFDPPIPSPVPEPSSFLLVVLGCVVIGIMAKRIKVS